MNKLNKKFGKLKQDNIEYAPATLRLTIHHHEEWDEEEFDEETGEPTGKTVHREYDYDTHETRLRPTAAEYLTMGWKRIVDKPDKTDAGYHAEPRGWTEDDDKIVRQYVAVKDLPPTVADFDAAMEQHLQTERNARGYTTREPDAYLESTNERWAQDARDWVAHRDDVMAYALAVMNDVEAGKREVPTMDEFVAGLPTITWTYEEA